AHASRTVTLQRVGVLIRQPRIARQLLWAFPKRIRSSTIVDQVKAIRRLMKKLDLVGDHRLMGRPVVDVEMIDTWVNADLTFRSSARCLNGRRRLGNLIQSERYIVLIMGTRHNQWRTGAGASTERGAASCKALAGSIRPAPNWSLGPSRLALAVRMRRTSAGVSRGLRSSISATMPLTWAVATDVPVVI